MAVDDPASTVRDNAALQQFLLLLGSAQTAAGDAVNEIQDRLTSIARAYGATDARFAVLPTFLVVALEPNQPATLEPTQQLSGVLRLDQTSALYELIKRAERAEIEPSDGIRRVADIVDMRPRYGPTITLLGHVLLTVGICFIVQPTWEGLGLAVGFGIVVGLLKLIGSRWTRVQMVMPVVAAFVVAGVTFGLAEQGWVHADLRAMIAPLVTFLPGAALTMGVVELSAAQLVSGASRLVSGVLLLLLLAFGIVAAGQVFGVPGPEALVNIPANHLGWWAPWLGIVVFGAGVALYHSPPHHSLPGLFLVLLVAFVGQRIGNSLAGGYVGAFLGAIAMTPTARLVERTPFGPPTLVSFLPAFWLLVPGAIGLIGVTAYVSSDQTLATTDFLGTVGAMIAVAVGVLCGYPLVDSAIHVYRQTANLARRIPPS